MTCTNAPRAALAAATLAALLVAREGSATPALRGPAGPGALTVATGLPEGGLAVGLRGPWSLTLGYRAGTVVSVGAGARWVLRGEPYGWGLELLVSGALGVVRPSAAPSVELGAALLVRRRWERFYGAAALVVPAQARLDGAFAVRVPAMLELTLGARAGRVWLGLAGGGGAVYVPQGALAFALQGTLYASLPLD